MAHRDYSTILGDTWDIVAFKMYKRARGELLMHLLLEANPEHRDTVIFSSGTQLIIPPEPINIPETLPPWKR